MASTHAYAIFSALYAPHAGGVESFTQRLAHQLSLEGNRVIIVTSRLDAQSPSFELQDDGVEVYRLPCRPLLGGRLPVPRKNRAFKAALDRLAAQGIDRVLVNVRFYGNSIVGVRFAKRIGAPVIVLDHGSAHLTLGNAMADRFVEAYEHKVTRTMMGLDPAFAGISQASAAWLEHFGIKSVAVIPNAIDVEEYQAAASKRDFREELGLGDDEKLVAFVGRLEPEKGALELAQAMGQLEGRCACAMAGDGSQREKIEALGLDNVALLGRLASDDLSALLRDADVFCLPSRSEGFCTSLLEAAAQKTMPVMPHVGGTDEVMGRDSGCFGVMLRDTGPATIADAIVEAMGVSSETAEALCEHVKERCSWEQTSQALDRTFSMLD